MAPFIIQSAIRTCNEALYFTIPILLCVVFKPVPQPAASFAGVWKEVPAAPAMYYQVKNMNPELANLELVKQRMATYGVHFLSSATNPKGEGKPASGFIFFTW